MRAACALQVASILDDSDAPLEYSAAAKAYLGGKLKLAWVDASQQGAWCRFHLDASSQACARWPWQDEEVTLVVFVAGGGLPYR